MSVVNIVLSETQEIISCLPVSTVLQWMVYVAIYAGWACCIHLERYVLSHPLVLSIHWLSLSHPLVLYMFWATL